jgi:ribose 5-phosphate isomerase B
MNIVIGSDHAGYRLKEHLQQVLTDAGHQVLDVGTHSEESCDYPGFAQAVGLAVVEGRADRGIMIGGSGIGESIACNKVAGIRAATCHECYTARFSRLHNDANVLCFGQRVIAPEMAEEILRVWLETPFSGDQRHVRRIAQIADLESANRPSQDG